MGRYIKVTIDKKNTRKRVFGRVPIPSSASTGTHKAVELVSHQGTGNRMINIDLFVDMGWPMFELFQHIQ